MAGTLLREAAGDKSGEGPWRSLAHPVAAVGRALDELEVVGYAKHRLRVAGQHDDRAGAEDGVDRPALESELAQVGAGQERLGTLEPLCR